MQRQAHLKLEKEMRERAQRENAYHKENNLERQDESDETKTETHIQSESLMMSNLSWQFKQKHSLTKNHDTFETEDACCHSQMISLKACLCLLNDKST